MKIHHSLWFLLLPLTISFSTPSQAETPELLRHTGGDVASTFGDWPIFILVGGVIGTSFLLPLDDNVDDYFVNHHVSTKMDKAGKWIGNPLILAPLSLAAYGSSFLTNNNEFKMTSETLLESVIFTEVMTEGLKLTFRRTRPNGGNNSFPSAHTSTVFDIASVLQSTQGWTWGVPAYAIASFVGFSRIDGGNHHLTDVVFGAVLGSSIGWGTSLFHKKETTNLLISPIFDQTRGIMVSYKF